MLFYKPLRLKKGKGRLFMNYKISEIAKLTVATAKKLGIPVNCSKLHLIITKLWVDYYRSTQQYLFNESISAGKTQPVISSVDLLYKSYGNNNISVKNSLDLITSIKQNDQVTLKKLLEPIIKTDANTLTKLLCGKNSAWAITKANASSANKPEIPFELLIKATQNEDPKRETVNAPEKKSNSASNTNKPNTFDKSKNSDESKKPNESKETSKPEVTDYDSDDFDSFFGVPATVSKPVEVKPVETVANTEPSEYIFEDEDIFASSEEEISTVDETPTDEKTPMVEENNSDEVTATESTESYNDDFEISDDDFEAINQEDIFDVDPTPDDSSTEIIDNPTETESSELNDELDTLSALDEISNDDFWDEVSNDEVVATEVANESNNVTDTLNDTPNYIPNDVPVLNDNYSDCVVTDFQPTQEQYKAIIENENNGLLKLGPIKDLGKKTTNLVIVPRDKINGYAVAGSYAIVSISLPKNKPITFMRNNRDFKGTLYVSFDDSDGKYGMKKKDAEKIAEFVIKMSNKAKTIIFQSDYGYSRSAGILAAVYNAFDMNGKVLFTNGNYCPNVHCYKLMLNAFNISYDENIINKLDNYSKEKWLTNHDSLPEQFIEKN